MLSTLINGLILGWSVAWPPGPVNTEMIRRGLLPRNQGGGFWPAWRVGLGACSGDFVWALAVATGAGTLLNRPGVRLVLGVISFILLIVLAGTFSYSAWKAFHVHRSLKFDDATVQVPGQNRSGSGYLLGFFFALSSPWNIGFWLAVVGSQQTTGNGTFLGSLALAGAVVLGAVTWTIVLCTAVRQGARIFSRPDWQVATQALTALVMVYFAIRLVLRFMA